MGAADLQKQMTVHLFSRFQKICQQKDIQLQVHFAGGSLQQMKTWLGEHVLFVPQCEGNLGDRIIFSLKQGFSAQLETQREAQLERIIVVGSDCPHIDCIHITQTLSLLKNHDIVLGPATDGGYYLIGLKHLWLPLFNDVPWSTHHLLERTLAIAEQMSLSVSLLEPLSDIDRPEDLSLWENIYHD